MDEKKWDLNPMRDAKGYLSRKEVKRVLEAASKRSVRDYVLVLTLLYTGRRVSEIVQGGGYGLRPKDIDFESRNITYRIMKKSPRKKEDIAAGKPRPEPKQATLPGNPMLLEVLSKFIQTNNIQADSFLFPMSRQRAFQLVRKVGEQAGVGKVGDRELHPHHFRHTFAVWISKEQIAETEDLVQLKELLQHSDIRMTMTYLRYGNTKARQLMENL